jgi:hypothetical protein
MYVEAPSPDFEADCPPQTSAKLNSVKFCLCTPYMPSWCAADHTITYRSTVLATCNELTVFTSRHAEFKKRCTKCRGRVVNTPTSYLGGPRSILSPGDGLP